MYVFALTQEKQGGQVKKKENIHDLHVQVNSLCWISMDLSRRVTEQMESY